MRLLTKHQTVWPSLYFFSFANVIFARNTRQGNRYSFRTENYQSSNYKSSPYFKGSTLRDNLPVEVLQIPVLSEFKTKIIMSYVKIVPPIVFLISIILSTPL